jgi:hypothetical protein
MVYNISMTSVAISRWAERAGNSQSSGYEQILDKYFSDEYMEDIFPYIETP